MSSPLQTVPILVDPATEAAMQIKQEQKLKEQATLRLKEDEKLYKKWLTNNARVNQFKKLHGPMHEENRFETVVEVFLTYDRDMQSRLKHVQTISGLPPAQEATMLLYPRVKDLYTGKVYSVRPDLAVYADNESARLWDNQRASEPNLEERIPRPPDKLWGFDNAWGANRFKINPFNLNMTPEDNYTFIISKQWLKTCVYDPDNPKMLK